jgi:hypothetical protein
VPDLVDVAAGEQAVEKTEAHSERFTVDGDRIVWHTFAAGIDAAVAAMLRAPLFASQVQSALLAAADRAIEAWAVGILAAGAPTAPDALTAMAKAGAAARCALSDVLLVGGEALASELVAIGQAGLQSNVVFTSETGGTVAAIASPGVAVLLTDPFAQTAAKPREAGYDVAVGRFAYVGLRRPGAVVTLATT